MAASRADASDPIAAEAAQQALEEGGRAADAAIAGFLAAAGAREAVLLSPVVALVGGLGAGSRLLDGRAIQPGAGAKRPRGFRPDEPIPAAARAAVPRSLELLALLQIYGARQGARTLVRAGLAHARQAGAERRRAFLENFGRRGAQAIRGGDPLRHLLRAGSATAGGLFTEADILDARPGDEDAHFRRHGDALEIAFARWTTSTEPVPTEAAATFGDARRTQVIVAADALGGVAALAYTPDEDGVPVPELELRLPRDAEPVRRSVPRVAPGTPRPAPAPIALLRRASEAWFAAVGVAGATELTPPADPEAPLIRQLETFAPARPALGASIQRRKAQLARVD